MTLDAAAGVLIEARPHVARWIEDLRTGARVAPALDGAADYLRRELDGQAAVSLKRAGHWSEQHEAGLAWSGESALGERIAVAVQIVHDACSEGRRARA